MNISSLLKKHISILTYLILFSCFSLVAPRQTLAACTSTTITGPGDTRCQVGSSVFYCSVTDCDTLRNGRSGNGGNCTSTTITNATDTRCQIGTNVFYCSAADCNAARANSTAEKPAVDPTTGCPGSTALNPEINTALGCLPANTAGFTGALLVFLAGISGAVSLVVMLVATIQIMTGGDNPEQVKKAKELFTGAIVGLFFIIFSVSLMKIIAGDIIKIPGFY